MNQTKKNSKFKTLIPFKFIAYSLGIYQAVDIFKESYTHMNTHS